MGGGDLRHLLFTEKLGDTPNIRQTSGNSRRVGSYKWCHVGGFLFRSSNVLYNSMNVYSLTDVRGNLIRG